MTNLQRRLRKLESELTDPSGLVPHSKAWFEHWERRIDQVIAGDDPGGLRGIRSPSWTRSSKRERGRRDHEGNQPAADEASRK